jgi:hypothetical protein
LFQNEIVGAESFVCDQKNKFVYTGLADGSIGRFSCDPTPLNSKFEFLVRTGKEEMNVKRKKNVERSV